jgi:hypothetical protein
VLQIRDILKSKREEDVLATARRLIKERESMIRTLRLIAGSDGAEASYPRADAAKVLREVGSFPGFDPLKVSR